MNFLLRHIHLILEEYEGTPPLAIYLKNYFRANRTLGSRDRKAISQAVYTYYRFAKRFPEGSTPFEIIASGLRYSNADHSFLKTMILKEFPEIESDLHDIAVYPLPEAPPLSEGISEDDWHNHFLTQPDMFIRTRYEGVEERLRDKNIPFSIIPLEENRQGKCIKIPGQTDVSSLLPADSYVVQDWASQKSISILLTNLSSQKTQAVWDCCAGAGGKSLMLKDNLPQVEILATDIRNSILRNLIARAKQYHLNIPSTHVLDLTDRRQILESIGSKKFDLILCDVPCSGSGTWARTPEQFYFFKRRSLKKWTEKQLTISSNVVPYLQDDGIFAYITCSVFREENEAVVKSLTERYPLEIIHKQLINGVLVGSDSMFIALLKWKS